jgi:polysaccharide deacetylase family protein (PEP-CTERM system associated)
MVSLPAPVEERVTSPPKRVILSFDVEEHYRIEAAAGLVIDPALKLHYRKRLQPSTGWLLEQLRVLGIRATFFIVGQIAKRHGALIRAIHADGHEIASHGWDHRRLHHFTPDSFREDVKQSKDALEQLTGEPVFGYRAPTFSVVPKTAWALDVLVEQGFCYDSSIYPVRHDRYGIPQAPRTPFMARGHSASILEIPPATLRMMGMNLPVGGGGYFRLLPLFMLKQALRQVETSCSPPIAMLYFHPWEFDPDQARLPLCQLSRFRTYVGLNRSRKRLATLLASNQFVRAHDVAKELDSQRHTLPRFEVGKSRFFTQTSQVAELPVATKRSRIPVPRVLT